METLEFGLSPILVPLLCGLKNYDIIGSTLHGGSFLIVNFIEQGHLLVVGTPMIF
jgi:predicted transcriptional regulator